MACPGGGAVAGMIAAQDMLITTAETRLRDEAPFSCLFLRLFEAEVNSPHRLHEEYDNHGAGRGILSESQGWPLTTRIAS